MVNTRYSSPPCELKLQASTKSLTASLDALERSAGSTALPAPELTDQQRLAVCRELIAFWPKSGCIHLDQAVERYTQAAKMRLSGKAAE